MIINKSLLAVGLTATFAFAGSAAAQDSSQLWKAKSPFLKSVQTQPHLEPTIPHPEWEQEASDKLKALEAKTGRKPNVLYFFVDDMGWGDPGVFGGGAAIGAATPNMDQLAREGMILGC